MSVKILSDSTCDLSKQLIEKYDIEVLPLHIVLGDKEYLDGVEIGPDEIYEWSDANKTTPKTSAVGFENAMDAMKSIVDTDDEMIIFTISEKMSTTPNVFRMAAEELEVALSKNVLQSNMWILVQKN